VKRDPRAPLSLELMVHVPKHHEVGRSDLPHAIKS